jgi:hypothetical protein
MTKVVGLWIIEEIVVLGKVLRKEQGKHPWITFNGVYNCGIMC